MFVRYGRAALTAAIMALAANAVRAQETCPAGGYYGGYAVPACCPKTSCCEKKSDCAASGCCKEGKCCKDVESCCKEGKCCKVEESCCKEGKCCKVEESCCKDLKCSTETKCPCCQLMSKLAKHTAIIMVMPSSMPLLGNCPLEAMGIVPHPPLPPGPHVMMPPVLTPPGIPPHPITMPMMPPPVPMPHCLVQEANTGNVIYGVGANPNCGLCGITASTCSPAVACSTCVAARRVSTAPRLIAKPWNDQLVEMSIGEDTSIHCKKMTVTIGDKAIALSIFDGRVRVRGEDLKATADSVRSDGKDRITLVGDVDLHYKNKESHSASVIRAGQVVVNLTSGTVTATQVDKTATVPTGYAAPYSK